jgi:DNA-binding response OmpR family regulator
VSRKVFVQPNVRLVIFDDQAVEESDSGWMLAQIRKHFSGISLLYVAANQSDGNEKRARTNGAHYYSSKPLSLMRFGYVLQSFCRHSKSKDNGTGSLMPVSFGALLITSCAVNANWLRARVLRRRARC